MNIINNITNTIAFIETCTIININKIELRNDNGF